MTRWLSDKILAYHTRGHPIKFFLIVEFLVTEFIELSENNLGNTPDARGIRPYIYTFYPSDLEK